MWIQCILPGGHTPLVVTVQHFVGTVSLGCSSLTCNIVLYQWNTQTLTLRLGLVLGTPISLEGLVGSSEAYATDRRDSSVVLL